MTDAEFKEYREQQMREAQEYQDFVCKQFFYKLGLPIVQLCSKKYQFDVGESLCGFEIKLDKNLSITGNVFIETKEKSKPSIENYVPSGIYRDDNSWIYIIGNYEKIFMFSKKHLRNLFESGKYKEIEIKTKTSKGFLIKSDYAEKLLAINVLYI